MPRFFAKRRRNPIEVEPKEAANGALCFSRVKTLVWFLFFLLLAALIIRFSGREALPENARVIDSTPKIYPDYVNATIPVNIAPLNFDVCEEADKIKTSVRVIENDGATGKPLRIFTGVGVRFPLSFWKKLTRSNAGKALAITVYVQRNGEWFRFNDSKLFISPDPIDPYVTYRLVAPGYERFSDVALWTRNIENFKEKSLIRARLIDERACVNCHTFQNRRTDNFFFHVRLVQGGTVYVEDGDKVSKLDMNADGLDGGCSYAAWRPNSKHVAFTVNRTHQLFRLLSLDRIDVLDNFADLYLYDVEKNELRPVVPPGDDCLETYPCWSQDGKYLYYCSAKDPGFTSTRKDDETRGRDMIRNFDRFKYDICRVSFDEKNGTFGKPELVFDASGRDKSALFPRVSPDGKTLIFTLTRFGCFPIWYKDADLWMLDLATGEARALNEINSPDEPDSYHSWDSSGRWIVFSSRRDDGSYTRLYFSHFNNDGGFSRPVMLPQKNPVETLENLRSYNVPEFTVEPVRVPQRRLLKEAKLSPSGKARAIMK